MVDNSKPTRYTLIHKHLPDCDGVIKFSVGSKIYDTREEAEKDADVALYQNLPYRSKVIEIVNPWEPQHD